MTVDVTDWTIGVLTRANTLIHGSRPDTDACVSALTLSCPTPVVKVKNLAATSLTAISKGTVILENVAEYSLDEQRDVLSWLDQTGSRVRVFATTPENLFDLVTRGQFLATLYYRLNVLFLDLASSSLLAEIAGTAVSLLNHINPDAVRHARTDR